MSTVAAVVTLSKENPIWTRTTWFCTSTSLSLLVGFGAGLVETVCLLKLRRAETLADAAPWGQLAGQIEKAFPVAIIGLYATGAYMTSQLWTWSTSWIVIPIVGFAVLSLQGPLVAGRRACGEAGADGERPRAARA